MKHLRWLMATALAVTVTACTLLTDITDPTIALNVPDGAVVRTGDAIVATAEDQESGIARLELLFNGAQQDLKSIPAGERDRRPVTATFDIPDGLTLGEPYVVEVIATNGVGREVSETFVVTIAADAEDTTPPVLARPTIEFITPFSGSTLSGDVSVAVTATAPSGVANVRLFAQRTGGASIQSVGTLVEDAGAYSITFPTAARPNGAYLLTASVTDSLGRAASVDLDVILDNTLTAYWLAPAPNTTASATTTLVVDALGGAELERAVFTYALGDATVQIGIDDDPSDGLSVDWTTTGLAAGIYTVSADLKDVTGRVATTSVDVVVPAATEDDLPGVIWATPAAGALLAGPTTTALAFDVTAPAGVGVVQAFLVAADADRMAITPLVDAGGGRYESTLDPALLPAGSYALVAEVRDLEGRVATAARAVTVAEQLPWVAFTSPTPDKRTAGKLDVELSFEARRGAKRVDLYLVGAGGPVQVFAEEDAAVLATGSVVVQIETLNYESGDYTLRAVIEDDAGNVIEQELSVVFLVPFLITTPADGASIGGGTIVAITVGVNGTILENYVIDRVDIFLNGLLYDSVSPTLADTTAVAIYGWQTDDYDPARGHPNIAGDRVITARISFEAGRVEFTPGVLINFAP